MVQRHDDRKVFWMCRDRRLFARKPADPAGAWVIEDHGRVVFDGTAAECIRWLAAAPLPDPFRALKA
ncbi:hypothetical protein [Xenophilus sp. Marseille-Q4582]|uniref:hypothetical protein n=1 Tax=Xenophilus sp. Marseille-Q4582 TaxID=2866600 RepID=UPI001CE4116B|nr:hypothetical protein [Xenophilus sp. Marseille-Q4582]